MTERKVLSSGEADSFIRNATENEKGDMDEDTLNWLFKMSQASEKIKDIGDLKLKELADKEFYYSKQAFTTLQNKANERLRIQYGFTVAGIRKLATELQKFHEERIIRNELEKAAGGANSDIVKGVDPLFK
jgi:hypothetical protein